MATYAAVKKPRAVANPTRRRSTRRKARRNPRGKMSASAKQAFVKRMAAARKRSNTKRRSNPTNMAKAKNPSRKRRAKRSRNPFKFNSRRRRNPTVLGRAGGFTMDAATALVTLVATRQLPQMLLAEKNAGLMGYAANLATTLLAAYGAYQFLSPRAANAALIGGGVYLVNRVLTEKVAPIGQYLALTGLGDAQAASELGSIQDGYFIHPTVLDSSGKPIIPQAILDASTQAARAAVAAQQPGSASPALTGVPSRFRSRR